MPALSAPRAREGLPFPGPAWGEWGGPAASWRTLGPPEGLLQWFLGLADVGDPGHRRPSVQASTSSFGSAPSTLPSATIIPVPWILEENDRSVPTLVMAQYC